MRSCDNPAHHAALAKNLGITPKHREATKAEKAFAAEWMRLRGGAYREEFEYSNRTQAKMNGHGNSQHG